MIIRKGDIIELWIDKLAFGGNGVARLDGFVIFVKDAVPGDRVIAQIVKKKKDYAEARSIEFLNLSRDRINPPCPYSGFCGGCQWQQLRYDRQVEYKREHLREALRHIGGIQEVKIDEVIPSEMIYAYRNKMEFSFSDYVWMLPGEYMKGNPRMDFGLGLHIPGTFYKVIDISECLLQHGDGNKILDNVRTYVRESKVPVYGLKSHEGFWRFLILRYSRAYDEWMVNIVTSEERQEIILPMAEWLYSKFSNISTVVNNINSRKGSTAFGEKEIVLTGNGYIKDKIGDFIFRVSANSFFQTNPSGAKRLYEVVEAFAELNGTETILDLYSGTGTIPVFLSGKARDIIGMEIVESAIIDAKINCRENGVKNCRFIQGDIRKNLSSLKTRPDLFIIDPPRSGMHRDVLSEVMDIAAEKLIYVSCNPSTLARDLAILTEKYQIREVQPVDMFPHTYHIESVTKLIRRR
ncbi:MAG: 23S rRNA (uracil(1939)-C(5))-methyltransferase RlmD [Deltaproteobacteria bacterium]|nr:23S rRNA (uracil(1939)-C(5))-methyltransferase RlmD [Deltaproteobacteria bacterium]